MAGTFFLDAPGGEPLPGPRRGTLAVLAGLIGAVALFVTTLSVVARSHEALNGPAAEPAASPTTAAALPRPQAPRPGAS